MIEKLFEELGRLQHNDEIFYVPIEDWKNRGQVPYFYIGRTYFELHSDGVLRYWYPHMQDEGHKADIESVIEDLKKIEAESETITVEAVVGSLILSPLLSKEENLKIFNNWAKETYETKH